jgi:hypothetical protein
MCASVLGPGLKLCSNNAQCQGGNLTCTDSNGGNNLAVRGTTQGWNSGIYYNHTDYCVTGSGYGNTRIAEGYCSQNTLQILHQTCPTNYTMCQNGRCV